MRHRLWAGIAVAGLASSLVVAQEAPEPLLPPAFGDPVPEPTPDPSPRATATARTPNPGATRVPAPVPTRSGEIVQPLPGEGGSAQAPPVPSQRQIAAPAPLPAELANLPTLEELENLSTDELDERLGLRSKFDIPPAARRRLDRVGFLTPAQGGLPSQTFARQPASLVRATIRGTRGPLVSRWGHILLRRALASRLASPAGMSAVEFAALRTQLLNRIGEHDGARGLVQSIDTAEWNDALTGPAVDAYLATGDILGICPAANLRGTDREGPQWQMLLSICNAYSGEATRAQADLERARRSGIADRIDVLLAQRYASAAGQSRRAVNVEWDEVDELTLWRFGLANAIGEPLPEELAADLSPYYLRAQATAPMLPLETRIRGAQLAGAEGILSADAMIDLYSQIYGASGEAGELAELLRSAYVANRPATRLDAIEQIWGGSPVQDYGRVVLTAYAAARLPVRERFAPLAAPLIASMLTAGLDRNAMLWAEVVADGSEAWALLALADPAPDAIASSGDVDTFVDEAGENRKARFLVAGLAGLDRLDSGARTGLQERLRLDLTARTRWAVTIDRAAAANNKGLVVLLAALGMQGDSWEQMTPRQLYQIVSSLDRVGLRAEARMIAAEAFARG